MCDVDGGVRCVNLSVNLTAIDRGHNLSHAYAIADIHLHARQRAREFGIYRYSRLRHEVPGNLQGGLEISHSYLQSSHVNTVFRRLRGGRRRGFCAAARGGERREDQNGSKRLEGYAWLCATFDEDVSVV